MSKPLMFDLFCGLGGATEGFLEEGWKCIGIDIERHRYSGHEYPSQLWIQDILTISGSQLRDADFLWASPPCQEYSYMAMPWTRSKAKAATIRADKTGKELERLNLLFNACFRIQREASEAAGRDIPMIVENVRGAQPWVGRSRWSFGSFHLWGDVPALMPITLKASKVPGFRFDGSGRSFQTASVDGLKVVGPKWDSSTQSGAYGMKRWTNPSEGFKTTGLDWSDRTKRGQDFTRIAGGNQTVKTHGEPFNRKMASAMIAKIPLPLSRYLARTFRPIEYAEAAE